MSIVLEKGGSENETRERKVRKNEWGRSERFRRREIGLYEKKRNYEKERDSRGVGGWKEFARGAEPVMFCREVR